MPARIRFARGEDAEQVHAIYEPIVENSVISFELQPPSVDDIRERIEETLREFPWLVLEHSDHVLGYAYAGRHRARHAYRWSVDVSVYSHSSARRRGVARGLYRSLFELLVLQGYYGAYAGIALPNAASVSLHEAVGFEPVGVYRGVGYKLGDWHDVGWWQRDLQPRSPEPARPSKLSEVLRKPECERALSIGVEGVRI